MLSFASVRATQRRATHPSPLPAILVSRRRRAGVWALSHLALLAVVAGMARGQESRAIAAVAPPVRAIVAAPAVDSGPAVPELLTERVAAAIAHQWGDDPEALTLVWGRVPRSATFPRTTDVRVLGRGEGGWFVAVFTPAPQAAAFAVRVRAGGRDSSIVATRTIDAGHALTAQDLRAEPRTRWGPPGDATASHITAGWVTRRTLMVGAEVLLGSVSPPPLVHAGDAVRLEWRRGAVLITLEGTALDAGGAGETVRVRLGPSRGSAAESKSGTVLATGLVRLES